MAGDDIFDKAAAAMKDAPKGDVFDQAAAASKAPAFTPPDTLAQAHQQMQQAIPIDAAARAASYPGASDNPSAFTARGQNQARIGENYNAYQKASGNMAGNVAGTMATAGVLPAIKGAGLAANALRLGGRALATGAGAGVGSLAGGATPQEAAVNAAGGVVAQPVAEGIGAVASPLMKWIGSSKTVGTQLLQQASEKAGSAPVALSPQTDEIVDKIVQQGKLGGTIPKVVTDLLDRVGPSVRHAADANPGPLTYNEARILQSNTSQMSAAEQMALKGQLKYLVPQLAKSLSDDVQAAANQAGIGELHAQGMKEYALASARNRVAEKIGKAGVKILPYAAGAASAYELAKTAAGGK
jgi:hypothetical protein